ncbi:hybrid-cluster NAD(P)-dependent oxidoreductase [Arhodomonas aquaeolei]|nr:hybrid-cluster NAD(P)-dependent oxidoreductase [Arhodomonas aquaeolei]
MAFASEYLNPVNTQTWVNGRHVVRCVKVIDETHDTRTFCFAAEQPILFFFKPGQFVTLELDIDGKTVHRPYTIASSPSIPYSFSITVKRVPGGTVSNWLHDRLQEGDEMTVHGPAGGFNCIDHPAERLLLLSGGVGITPLMSMARWLFDMNARVDIVFVHSARTPQDIIYRGELEYMTSRIGNFTAHLICERTVTGESWTGYRGFLDERMLSVIAPDFLDRKVFCCGPGPYMDAVRGILARAGFDHDHYHEESFDGVRSEMAHAATEDDAAQREEQWDSEDLVDVQFAASGMSIQVKPTETVHSAAARLGINIPKACGMGICGTCRVLKVSGEVEMNDNGGITEEEQEEGYILSCCSHPSSAVVVDY